jgi:transcriptional repressor NrdR
MLLHMVCPYCEKIETNVIDSRKNNDGKSIRRRRECPSCEIRFTTYEKAEIEQVVLKNNGNIQPFDYEKLYKGVENAFGGLDLSEKQLKNLVDNIHADLKLEGNKIKSEFIGETVLNHLKEANEVAYLRFASVYKEFSDASDFQKEVDEFTYGKSEKLS